ncbi:MAG: IPT/TIG domain-containing protein [Candidatus Sulfotelmatobacter sp.]
MLKTLSQEMTAPIRAASTMGSFLLRLAVAIGIVLVFAALSHAGGPKYVAGTTYFNANMTGQPLTWPLGQIIYYTDQGDLSPILPNAAVNSLVANAFGQWTAVSTAALNVSSGGELAEDVNGSNVTVNSDGSISMPPDIQPSATSTPLGVVYDYDGSVTDALMGAGAGDASQCFFNSVFGGNDNYGALGTYQHALIVINGQCAQESSQVVDIEYRLVRVMGTVLGLGWSQANPNVLTGAPSPTSDDYAGFPVMHYSDPAYCVPITNCYANPFQQSADDVAALSRLYPVTSQNQANFPGTQIFSSVSARVHGSIWFTDVAGNPTQPMQGVNVVARWINPATGQPSRKYVVTSVSGFLFTGNAGNPVTGPMDALGDPFSDWGSTNPAQEGFFDLAGLPLPAGGNAQYQLTVEAIDSTWALGVGPYAPYQVRPSGSMQSILVTVSAGQDVAQDILMTGSAQPVPPWSPTQTWSAPAHVPKPGAWTGSLNGYGNVAYALLPAQANRTLSVAVTALDESGAATQGKAQPVIGMWTASDAQGSMPPAFTPSPFNSTVPGMTLLNAQVSTSANFIIGIADLRGDGRPDYRYRMSVLYADAVSPQRLAVSGGALAITGIGFSSAVTVSVGSLPVRPLAVSAGQMIVPAPAFPDGPQSITLTDPLTGNSSTMTDAVTYGAAASDNIVLLSGTNPSAAVGTQATNPVSVRVLAGDGVTPVAGATIGWSASNGLQLSICGGHSSCTMVSDQSGNASTWLIPAATGSAIITATLAPGVYVPSKSVQANLTATESASDLGVLTPYLWIAQGATVSVPLTARVLSNGIPQANATVNFSRSSGSAVLSAASARTDSNGNATVTLSASQFASGAQVNACVAPANAPCKQIYANPVPLAQLNLQAVSGAGQISMGQSFAPVVVRVVDAASPPHAVLGATVTFLITALRPQGASSAGGGGESNSSNPGMPVILSVSQASVMSDINGLATVTPVVTGLNAPLDVEVAAAAGTSASLNSVLELFSGSGTGTLTGKRSLPEQPPIRRWPGEIPALGATGSRVSDNCR